MTRGASGIRSPHAPGPSPLDIWSTDLSTNGAFPAWMIELAQQIGMIEWDATLPTGVIVGSAVISKCEALRHEGTEAPRGDKGAEGSSAESSLPAASPVPTSCLRASVPSCLYAWHLTDIERAKTPRKPKRHPQPVWFKPF